MSQRNRPRSSAPESRRAAADGRHDRRRKDEPPRDRRREDEPRTPPRERRAAASPRLSRQEALAADGAGSAGDEAGFGEQYLAGKHPVLEALRAGRALNKIWLSHQAQRSLVQPIVDEAKGRGVVVQFADKKKLDALVPGLQHQGVVAQAAAVSYADVDDLLALAKERNEPPLIVLLDEVEDPHNLGSILRTADCAGAHGIVVPKRRSAGLTAVVAKASAGAVEYVPVARVANLAQTIDKLKDAGVWIAGADAAAPQNAFRANLAGPLAIVIGSEGAGISRLVREKCDFLISLPMFGRIHSLNASVAAGVILYEAVRQRQALADRAAADLPEAGDGHVSP